MLICRVAIIVITLVHLPLDSKEHDGVGASIYSLQSQLASQPGYAAKSICI